MDDPNLKFCQFFLFEEVRRKLHSVPNYIFTIIFVGFPCRLLLECLCFLESANVIVWVATKYLPIGFTIFLQKYNVVPSLCFSLLELWPHLADLHTLMLFRSRSVICIAWHGGYGLFPQRQSSYHWISSQSSFLSSLSCITRSLDPPSDSYRWCLKIHRGQLHRQQS